MIAACLGIQAGWFVENPMINNPVWYVSVLLLCYVVMYLATWSAKKLQISPKYFYILIIFIGIGTKAYQIEWPFINRSYSSRGYIAFFWGLILADILKKIDLRSIRVQVCSLLMGLAVIMVIATGYKRNMNLPITFILWPSAIILSYSKTITGIFQGNFWSQWAKISFDVYIWHAVVLGTLKIIPIKERAWSMSLWGLMMTLALCQIVGWLSWRFIERPLDKAIRI